MDNNNIDVLKQTVTSGMTSETLYSALMLANWKSDCKRMDEILQKAREKRNQLSNIIKSDETKDLIEAVKYTQTFNIFNQIYSDMLTKQNMEEDLTHIMEQFPEAKEILLYMLQKVRVSNAELLDKFQEIKKKRLVEILELLDDSRCIVDEQYKTIKMYRLSSTCETLMRYII